MDQDSSQSDKTERDVTPTQGTVAHYRIIGKLGAGGIERRGNPNFWNLHQALAKAGIKSV